MSTENNKTTTMKKLNFIIALTIVCAHVQSQNFTDSFYHNEIAYYCMQPKSAEVRWFYPKEKYTPYMVHRIQEMYPELVAAKVSFSDTATIFSRYGGNRMSFDSTWYQPIIFHDVSYRNSKDYSNEMNVPTQVVYGAPTKKTFKIFYSYTLIGKNKTGTKTIVSYHYPTFQDVLSKIKIPKQIPIGDVTLSMYEQ